MSEIAELERRITAALERIGRGLDDLAPVVVPDEPAPIPAPAPLAADLLAERAAARAETAAAAERETTLRAEIAHLTRQLDERGLDMQRMRLTVIQLRETLRSLREAQAAGLTDVTALNAAMTVELEALRVERQAELAEMDAILAELKPLTAEVQDA